MTPDQIVESILWGLSGILVGSLLGVGIGYLLIRALMKTRLF